jgi:hypothetical protein
MYGALVVGGLALAGALVAGLFDSELALWLFPVWFGAAVVFVAGAYGVGYLLRMLVPLTVAGIAVVAAALVLPWSLVAVLGPTLFTAALVVFRRRERRRWPQF